MADRTVHLIVTRTFRVEVDESQPDEAELLAAGDAKGLAKLIRRKVGEFDQIEMTATIVRSRS